MTLRITWARVAATLAVLFAGGMAFAWSGILDISASSGHWKVTDWFLHWAMRNSVRTHTALASPETPRPDDGLVSAAGHFANACASCHGAPGVRPLPVMQQATPPAPDLAVNAREWTTPQIAWILQHGVKYTGMPAWGARDRADEVRRMTGFVRRLPTMTPAQYAGLVAVPTEARGIATCTGCHGADGRGRGQGDIPVLGGQRADYLLAALRAYATGTRQSAVMAQAAAPLTDTQMRSLAAEFAAMPGLGSPPGQDDAARRLVERGDPAVQLPACASCHRPGTRYPVLAGQRADYIAARLRRWRGDDTVVDARKPQATMPVIARRIPEAMIDPLARYLSAGVR